MATLTDDTTIATEVVQHPAEIEPYDDEVDAAELTDDDEGDPGVVGLVEEDESVVEEDEPSYRANKMKFSAICQRMDELWQLRTNKKKNKRIKDIDKMMHLLPPGLIKAIEPQSLYPILRLMIPEVDNSRNTYVKEKFIAAMYTDALGLVKGQEAYEKLFNFTNPQHNKLADLSVAVEEVVKDRTACPPSNTSVGEINDLLDKLCSLRKSQTKSNHDWREASQTTTMMSPKKPKRNINEQRAKWMHDMLYVFQLSPLEHKWLVRIMLKQMEMGVGWRTILKWYHPYAMELWNAHNSLKAVCNKICRKNFQQKVVQTTEVLLEPTERHLLMASYMEGSSQDIEIDKMFGPMLSVRSSFESVMYDLSFRHAKFLKEWQGGDLLNEASMTLACKFPTFCMEVKLDGERMIVHIKNGRVKMHSRNSKWYSDHYSPVLGPAFRKAIAKYDVDVILDGEVSSWDDCRKEYVAFGNNKTVAANHKRYMKSQGLLDDRDFNLHPEGEEGVHRVGDSFSTKRKDDDYDDEDPLGCWLKFEAFDVVYVGGKDASKLLKESVSKHRLPHIKPGSLMQLDGFERKKILYRLIDPQPNQIEIVPTLVVRSNGHTAKGQDYFSPDNPIRECGHAAYKLDSIDCTLNGAVSNIASIDERRRGGYTDEQIQQLRVEAVENFYGDIVDDRMLEGLIFKDLSAPYVLGDKSRRLRYWHKIKPDYALKSWASDIDVVILGAFYGTGLKNSGVLSHFLCGCVDSDNPRSFLTFCKINGRSVNDNRLQAIMDWTGYKKSEEAGDSVSFGKWYKEQDHGNVLPDFISHRSFQKGRENSGWGFNRSDQYPDLWIHPEDSVVLTIYGGEITVSDDFSVGLTLRFPRIERVRLDDDDGNDKPVFEVASDLELWKRFQDADQRRSDAEHPRDFHAGAPNDATPRRAHSHGFLTPEQYLQTTKTKRRRATQAGYVWSLPNVEVESSVLQDISFTVFDGKYRLDKNSLDAEEAREQGWFEEASKVKSNEDVMKFILRHGGRVKIHGTTDCTFILGGHASDSRVANFHEAQQKAWAQVLPKNPRTKMAQAIESLRQCGGVLKWTFVFSLVQRWLKERRDERRERDSDEGGYVTDDEEDNMLSILLTKPELLTPKPSDYLIASDKLEEDNLYGLKDVDEVTMTGLKRALDAIISNRNKGSKQAKRTKDAITALVPWQFEAVRSLPTQDRWIMGGEFETLWPYSRPIVDTLNEKRPVVLFPDIFMDSFGLSFEKEATDQILSGKESAQWNEKDSLVLDAAMESSISLAQTMGALITPHLHDGVTHVLCSMLQEVDMRVWTNTANDDIQSNLDSVFFFPKRGERLVQRLRSLHASGFINEVRLVSPQWVKSQWTTPA